MFKLILIAEIEDADNESEAQAKLDAFREAVQPSNEYGICLYRNDPDLLAACQTARDELAMWADYHDDDKDTPRVIAELEAAIAAVRGKTASR